MYLSQLTEQLSVSDSFEVVNSRVVVTVTFVRLVDNLHVKRSSEYIRRKTVIGAESKYKNAFQKAGLKEPLVKVIFHDP